MNHENQELHAVDHDDENSETFISTTLQSPWPEALLARHTNLEGLKLQARWWFFLVYFPVTEIFKFWQYLVLTPLHDSWRGFNSNLNYIYDKNYETSEYLSLLYIVIVKGSIDT
jgi:hypothetical protein